MANTAEPVQANRPGPKPLFTERMDLRLRPDQVAGMERIAAVIGVTQSDLVRWFIDSGIKAFNAEALNELERLRHGSH